MTASTQNERMCETFIGQNGVSARLKEHGYRRMHPQRGKMAALSGFASLALLSCAIDVRDAGAQESQPRTVSRAEIATTDNANSSAPQPEDAVELDMISITATRKQTQLLDIPGTVSVIGRDTIDQLQINNNQELVRYLPGISVDRTTSGVDPWGNLGGFTIRGVSGNRVQIQVDGSRIQERITDGNRNFTDMPGLKAVEIVRGPGSVLWGADALGGIVAFRTLDPDDLLNKKPDGANWASQVETSYDSIDNSFSKTAMFAAQFNPQWQGLVLVNQKTYNEAKLRKARADGGFWGCPRTPDAIRCNELNPLSGTTWSTLGKLVFRPSADHEFKLTGETFSSSATAFQLYDYGRQANGSFNGEYNREQKQTRYRLAFSHAWTVGAPWLDSLRWNVSWSPQKRALDSWRHQINTARQHVVTNAINDYSEDFLQGDIQLSSYFDLLGARHNLTYGFQGDIATADYTRFDNIANVTQGTTSTSKPAGFANADTWRADFYIQDEIRMFDDRLVVTPGLRWANYQISPRPNPDYVAAPGREPRQLSSSKVIPQIGVLFRLNDQFALYARYAEGFKMPTAQQLYSSSISTTFITIPNPDLRPESVRSYEGGLRGKFDNGWFSIGAFHADYNDFIQNFYQILPNTYTYRNLTSVKIWGIEASGEYHFNESWALSGALSWQHGKQQYELGDRFVPYDGAAPLNGTLGLKWMKPEWGLETEVRGVFSSAVTRASAPNLFKPGAYAVFDAFANWKIDDTFTLRAAVLNIFDTRYFKGPFSTSYSLQPLSSVASTNPLELQTAPGRTFRLSAVANF